MEIQMWQSQEIDKLVGAIARAQARLKPVPKKCTNPYFNSKYADLADVMEGVAPFTEEGIAITQFPMEAPAGQLYLDTQLSFGNQWMHSRLSMTLAKNDPQGMGSAITYARRYALGCMTGLVTDEDNDGNMPKKPAVQTPKKVEAAPGPTCQAQLPGQEDGARENITATLQASNAPAPNYGVFIWQYGPKYKGFQIVDIPYNNLEWFSKSDKTPEDHREAALIELDRRRTTG